MITSEMVGGGAGGSYDGITETNNGSTSEQLTLPAVLDGEVPALSGFGKIAMQEPTDAFFFHQEYQEYELDLAYVVISDANPNPPGLTLGILGEGTITSGEPGGAFFGDGDPVPILLIPEPGFALLWVALIATTCTFRRFAS